MDRKTSTSSAHAAAWSNGGGAAHQPDVCQRVATGSSDNRTGELDQAAVLVQGDAPMGGRAPEFDELQAWQPRGRRRRGRKE